MVPKSLKKALGAAVAALLLTPLSCLADDFDRGMDTLWEVLWHQSGVPTQAARWEEPVRVAFVGRGATSAQHDKMIWALREVSTEAGVKLDEVADPRKANFTVEVVANTELQDVEPCVTYLNMVGARITDGFMKMRAADVDRCALHESMHTMGLRGHPAGDTVLSYTPVDTQKLSKLDRVMLRAWYAPSMRTGMNPFESLAVMGAELARGEPDPVAAAERARRYEQSAMQQSEAFAAGGADAPSVVRRSGKLTDKGVEYGRSQMSLFLGEAYERGVIASTDRDRAARWFERAASLGDKQARAQLDLLRNKAPRY